MCCLRFWRQIMLLCCSYGTDIGRHNAVAAIAVLACCPEAIETALEWGAIPLISAMLLAVAGGDGHADDFERELKLAEMTARAHALRVQTHHAPVGMEHKLSLKKAPSHDERECVVRGWFPQCSFVTF